MKEFIDKLIERLEEKKNEHLHDEKVMQELGKKSMAKFCSGKAWSIDGVIEIVNGLADEYKHCTLYGRRVDMVQEIELIKRNEVERLAIANTLLDSVARDTDLNLVSKILNDCMEKVTDCIVVLDKIGD